MKPIELSDVIDAMHNYGGGFVSALATAWSKADGENQKRLKEVFGDLYQRYEIMAREDDAKHAGAQT